MAAPVNTSWDPNSVVVPSYVVLPFFLFEKNNTLGMRSINRLTVSGLDCMFSILDSAVISLQDNEIVVNKVYWCSHKHETCGINLVFYITVITDGQMNRNSLYMVSVTC